MSAQTCLESIPRTEVLAGLKENSVQVDRSGKFSRDNWRHLAGCGLLGSTVPCEYGGSGASAVELAGAIREIGRACPSTGLCYLMHSCAVSVIASTASDSIKRRYLPRIAAGEVTVAYAGTERATGTNFWALESHAERVDGGWRLKLEKNWATLADAADLFVVPTRAGVDARPTEISLFLVERADGVWTSDDWRGTGMRGSSSGPVKVEAVVPHERMLGVPGQANGYVTTDMFNLLLLSHAALYAAIAEESFHLAIEQANRRTFSHTGEALGETSLWQCRLGLLSAKIASCRELVEATAREMDSGAASGLLLKNALAAKIRACAVARESSDWAMQISGGSGYNVGQRVEMLWRDARAGSLMRPSDEVAQMILGRLECGRAPFETVAFDVA